MRRADRAVTDRERILQVIESCECCRVGFSCPEGAYIVPLNFAFVPGTPDRFYFHGAQEGRKADLIRTAPRVGFELDCAHALTDRLLVFLSLSECNRHRRDLRGAGAGGKKAGAVGHHGAL